MSEVSQNYYYADAPSPLHDALDAFVEERRWSTVAAAALAERVGAKAPISNRCVVGFTFDGDPPAGWKEQGYVDGKPYFAPQKRGREGKELHKAMADIKFTSAGDFIVNRCKLDWMAFDGRMWRTVCGFKDGRVFIVVPTGGQGNDGVELQIPDYLIPCRKWEMDKWFDDAESEAA